MFALLLALQLFAPAPAPALIITVSGVPSSEGDVLVGLWVAPDGFLEDDTRIAGQVRPARAGEQSFVFDGLAPGTYAVSVLHDADRNGRMSKSFLGWPTEAYGFSRDARNTFSAPHFEDCAFELRSDRQIRIALK